MAEYWRTSDEIRFLRTTVPPFGLTRYEFLSNYKEAIKFRENWDVLNKEEIEAFLTKEIEKEIQNGGN
jgi:hypothetical protein